MAARKDNLPLRLQKDDDSTGTITYANEVIAIIAGVAANEVQGIAGMCTSGGISEVFGRYRNITKGVKVEIGSEEASVDLFVVVEYGTPIQTAAQDVQENVRKAIETMTGLHVVRVDVHVQGVSFEKENKETQAGLASADLPKVGSGKYPAKDRDKEKDKAERPPAKVILEETPKPEPDPEPAPIPKAQAAPVGAETQPEPHNRPSDETEEPGRPVAGETEPEANA